MTAKIIGKQILKTSGIIIGCFLVLLTAFHFWLVYHAEEIIQDMVAEKSNGKIVLDIRNFKFNWFSKKMSIEDAVFHTTDSVSSGTTYRFAVRRINLKVTAIYPMIFENSILITTLSLKDPDIVVTRLRPTARDTTRPKGDVSIPQEMGRIYNSIQDALQVLQVNKFEIEDASFSLINKMDPEAHPLLISHIDFHIDNLKVDTAQLTGKEKIFFSDNVVLKSRDQDIIFPDGRHRLSYRKFRINIEKKIVEFDSCTISAMRSDSAANDFSIFFDELVMTNIDFDTLYRSEVIKADSVYCINPQFKLNVNLDRRTSKKNPPKLEEIIRQLTGDMYLNFVVVNNASFDIKTIKKGVPNSFTSKDNNFEMQGLQVDKGSRRPIKVRKFGMAIRNYENFLRDSTYEMQFDSVLFVDDKILLSDFSFRKIQDGKTINSFKMPRFQLTGLSWDDLLFEQKLRASQVTLYDPQIVFREKSRKNSLQKRRNLFDVLASINDVIMLDDLHIINGQIDLKLNGGVNLNLKDATLSVESRSLLGSSQFSGIRRSVNYLDFKKGILKIDDMTVQLDDINFTGVDSRLIAGTATISNTSKTVDAVAKGVTMNQIVINETNGDVSIGGVSWEKADIKIDAAARTGKGGGSFISLTDINGKNTSFNAKVGGKKIVADIDQLQAVAILIKPGEKPIVGGLAVEGKNFSFTDPRWSLAIKRFDIADQENASLTGFHYNTNSGSDSATLIIPSLSFVPNIQLAIGGELHARDILINKPVIRVYSGNNSAGTGGLTFPTGQFNRLVMEQPELYFSKTTSKGTMAITWNGQKTASNRLVLDQVNSTTTNLQVRQLSLALNNFLYSGFNGKTIDAGEGEVNLTLQDIVIGQSDTASLQWTAKLSSLEGKNFVLDSVGKKAGRFTIKSVILNDLALNNHSLNNIRTMVKENANFRLQQVTGAYVDSENRFGWYNAGYDNRSKMAFMDSFSYRPTPHKDEFVASKTYQTDYLQIKTGAIQIGPFDIAGYLRDTIIRAGIIRIDNIDFNDFRDNRPPFRSGIIKPLMVDRVKNIPVKLSVDTLVFNNAYITYAELNPKTNQTGVILFNRTILKAFPVRNYDFSPTDSLRIHANGYLMDSIWVRLRLKQSYIDSLSGFLLTLRLRPVDLRVLNPVLPPLASALVKSGNLDTLSMRVAGGEYLAYGEMDMFYHDLKIEILKNGTLEKRGFFSFLANSLIKNKNTNKTHNVFFIRNRERSSINYLIKILMSGVNTSIGAKNNRKIEKQYKKELRQRNLPPVDYD